MADISARIGQLHTTQLWRRLSVDHRRLMSATILVAALTVAVKIISLGREMLVASHLGTTDAKDAFVTAWLIPGFLAWLIGSGIVGALLPVFVEARSKKSNAEMRDIFGEAMAITLGLYVIISLLLIEMSPVILGVIAPGYGPEKLALTHDLYLILLPAVVLTGLVTVWSGILNAVNRFALGAISPAIIPAASAIAITVVPAHSVTALAWGFVVGSLIQCVAIGYGVWKLGYGLPVRWRGGLPETRRFLQQLSPLIANGIVFGGLGVIDVAVAASLGPGNPAILAYGTMLVLPIMSVTCTALGTTIFPYFAQLAAANDWNGLRSTIRTYGKVVLLATIPMTVFMILGSHFLVQLLFERGQFTAADTAAVAKVQAVYALVIPIETLAVMMSRVVITLRASQLMMYGSIGIFAFNIAADILLSRWIGVEGIVLATVLNQLISLIFLIYLWQRLWKQREVTP